MMKKRFNKVKVYLSYEIFDNKTNEQLDVNKIVDLMNQFNDENEQLKQQLSDINGQLVMLDNCDNWDYDRMKHTVREIAEIIGYKWNNKTLKGDVQ